MFATAHAQPYRDAPAGSEDSPREYAQHARYAIYFAPHRDSVWWNFGCAWLGRDPIADAGMVRFALPVFDPAFLARITAAPRRYGFHATLKAPFRLKADYTAQDVYLQAANLAQSLMVAALPPLQLCVIDGFAALSFARQGITASFLNAPAVTALAAQCVSGFDYLRARPDAMELAHRQAAGLTPRQANLLAEWGYPYVFQDFRFHMTLTGHLSTDEQQQIIHALAPTVAALNAQPLLLDALAVYCQPTRDAPFVLTRRYGFDGKVDIYRDEA